MVCNRIPARRYGARQAKYSKETLVKAKAKNFWSALVVWYNLLTAVVNNDLQG